MSEKSKKKVAALAAFADLLLLQTHTHTHTLVQLLLHMLQASSSANSYSKTEVQTTTFSWRHQTPQNNSKSRENLHGNSTKTWRQVKERRLKTNEESKMSKKQKRKHDRKFCALQKFIKQKALKTFENLYLVNINSALSTFSTLVCISAETYVRMKWEDRQESTWHWGKTRNSRKGKEKTKKQYSDGRFFALRMIYWKLIKLLMTKLLSVIKFHNRM